MELTLSNLMDGAAQIVFARELQTVIEDIHKKSKNPTKERTITITFKIASDMEREKLFIDVVGNTKIAASQPIAGTAFTHIDDSNKPHATVDDVTKQNELQTTKTIFGGTIK